MTLQLPDLPLAFSPTAHGPAPGTSRRRAIGGGLHSECVGHVSSPESLPLLEVRLVNPAFASQPLGHFHPLACEEAKATSTTSSAPSAACQASRQALRPTSFPAHRVQHSYKYVYNKLNLDLVFGVQHLYLEKGKITHPSKFAETSLEDLGIFHWFHISSDNFT